MIKFIDGQGRVVIPMSIRKETKISVDTPLDVASLDDKTIRTKDVSCAAAKRN